MNKRGSVAIEFAFALPVLLVFVAGLAEVTHALLLRTRAERAVHSMAAAAMAGNKVMAADLEAAADGLTTALEPYTSAPLGVTFSGVFWPYQTLTLPSGVNCAAAAPCVAWQYSTGASGASAVGAEGGAAQLPGELPAQHGANYVVAELWVEYVPLLPIASGLIPSLSAQTLYYSAVYTPVPGTHLVLE